MVPGPRFELGTTNKNNEKTLFMPGDQRQMSKYGAFKKTSIPLPYQYISLGVVFCFSFKSHWYGSSGDLVTSEVPEELISGSYS